MFKSLRGKSVAIVIASVIVIAAVMGGIFIPKQVVITSDVIQDYMIDVTMQAGKRIDAVKELSSDFTMDSASLGRLVSDIKVREFPSSYCYVVGQDGTILYHPTKDRIGKHVENEVIANVVVDVKNGLHPYPEYKETVYQGTKKVVTYYVSDENDFILIMTADKSDVQNITSKNLIRLVLSCLGIIHHADCQNDESDHDHQLLHSETGEVGFP